MARFTSISDFSEVGRKKLHEIGENSSVFVDFLKFHGRVFKHNINVSLEFFAQRPDSQFIATRNQWKNANRTVISDSNGIHILDGNGGSTEYLDFSQIEESTPPPIWTLNAFNADMVKAELGISKESPILGTLVSNTVNPQQITECMAALGIAPNDYQAFGQAFINNIQLVAAGRMEIGGNHFDVKPNFAAMNMLTNDSQRIAYLTYVTRAARSCLMRVESAMNNIIYAERNDRNDLRSMEESDRGRTRERSGRGTSDNTNGIIGQQAHTINGDSQGRSARLGDHSENAEWRNNEVAADVQNGNGIGQGVLVQARPDLGNVLAESEGSRAFDGGGADRDTGNEVDRLHGEELSALGSGNAIGQQVSDGSTLSERESLRVQGLTGATVRTDESASDRRLRGNPQMGDNDEVLRRRRGNEGNSLSSSNDTVNNSSFSILSDGDKLSAITLDIEEHKSNIIELFKQNKINEALELTRELEVLHKEQNELKQLISVQQLTEEDVKELHSIEPPRKSVHNLSEYEVAASPKFESLLRLKMGEKSPYVSRELDNSRFIESVDTVPIIAVTERNSSLTSIRSDIKEKKISRGTFVNDDTGLYIQVSRSGLEDTVHYANKHNDNVTLDLLYNVEDIIKNAVLFDSKITQDNNNKKANNTAFMHNLFSVCKHGENLFLAKITVEEFLNDKNDTSLRLYNLQCKKIESSRHVAFAENQLAPSVLEDLEISIPQLYELVKTYDDNYFENPQAVGRIEREAELYVHAEYTDTVTALENGAEEITPTETEKQLSLFADVRGVTVDDVRTEIEKNVDTYINFSADSDIAEKMNAAFEDVIGKHDFSDEQKRILMRFAKYAAKYSITEDVFNSAINSKALIFKSTYKNRDHLSSVYFNSELDNIEHELNESIHQHLSDSDSEANTVPQIIYSFEQYGQIRFYKANTENIEDILNTAANADIPFAELQKLGEPLSVEEYAVIEQSSDVGYSLKLNFDDDTVEIYAINDGNGGIPEGDRTDDNVSLTFNDISNYKNVLDVNEINEEENHELSVSEQEKVDTNINFSAHELAIGDIVTLPEKPNSQWRVSAIKEMQIEFMDIDAPADSLPYVIYDWGANRDKLEYTLVSSAEKVDTYINSHSEVEPIPEEEKAPAPKKSEWRYYVIPDLHTWASNGKEKTMTPIEYYDTFEEAKARFDELRNEPYNSEYSISNGSPAARLTLGIDSEVNKAAVDILHVRADQNSLVDDFTRMSQINENTEAMSMIRKIAAEIGFDVVRSYPKLENGSYPNEPVVLSLSEWDFSYMLTDTAAESASEDYYHIYQMKKGEKYHGARFESFDRNADMALNISDYDYIHEGRLADIEGDSVDEKLNNIFLKFNTEHPSDFKGHSLSVSDVVVLSQNGNETIHYVDTFGFKNMPDFFNIENTEQVEPVSVSDHEEKVDTNINFSDSPMYTARNFINDFCIDEYSKEADFSDLSRIEIAYTTDPDTNVEIQVFADLQNFRLVKEYGSVEVSEEKFASLEEMNEDLFPFMDFNELVSLTDEQKNIVEAKLEVVEAEKKELTRSERLYKMFTEMYPDLVSGEHSYERYGSHDDESGYEQLSVEHLGGSEYGYMTSYIQNGDLMRDPDFTFALDHDNKQLIIHEYQQDGVPPYGTIYQRVYDDFGEADLSLKASLEQNFLLNLRNAKAANRKLSEYYDRNDNSVIIDNGNSEHSHDDIRIDTDDYTENTAPPEIVYPKNQSAKIWANMQAISELQRLEAAEANGYDLYDSRSNQRNSRENSDSRLRQYSGWGGLPEAFDETKRNWYFSELKKMLTPEEYKAARDSTLNAHFTPQVIIDAMYKAVQNMGLPRDSRILEPSCGTGNFISRMPHSLGNTEIIGIEIDSITARIARQLNKDNPNVKIINNGFEHTQLDNNSFDLAIGNVPFGDYNLNDPDYVKDWRIHDAFFRRALDKVASGGVVAFITSSGTLDKVNPKIREYLATQAELVGAIRLPNNAFSDAGTKVTSDIIFLQKRQTPLTQSDKLPDWCYTAQNEDGLRINSYFVQNPQMILGKMEKTTHFDMLTCKPFEGASLEKRSLILLTCIHYNTFSAHSQSAILALFPIGAYNGKRSCCSSALLKKINKWTFYIFYPLHLLILNIIDSFV